MPMKPERSAAWLTAAAVGAASGIAASAYNQRKAKQAEAQTPPVGQFIDADGARLHYLRRGSGPPVVLLHGNGVMLQDWLVSGAFDALAESHEVIAFDRPGFGYSSRPRTIVWSPERQARSIAQALQLLGVGPAVVVGHSFGTLVALALGLNHPELVSRLVLIGGLYFPAVRPDLLINAGPAVPIFGDVLRFTIAPIAGRAMMPALERTLFGPAPVAPQWARFPIEMVLRPSQVRATAADAMLVGPTVTEFSGRYGELTMPLTIVAGDGDKVVDWEKHSRPLHETLAESRLVVLPGVGHMAHYTALEDVLETITASPTSAPTATEMEAAVAQGLV